MHLWFISVACTANPTKYTEYTRTVGLDSGGPEAGDTEIRPDDTGLSDTETGDPPVDTDSNDEVTPPGFPSFSVEDVDETQVRFQFEYTGNVLGGHLVVAAEGREFRFLIPDELETFTPTAGSALWNLPPCSGGDFFHFSAFIEDRRGGTTSTRDGNITISGWGETIESAGVDSSDDFESWGDGIRIGNVPKGGLICGDMYGAGHSGSSYNADIDFIEFRAADTDTYVINLEWLAENSDYDIDIWTQSFEFLGGSYVDSTTPPESFTINLVDGEPYILRVAGWAGQGGFYQIRMQ